MNIVIYLLYVYGCLLTDFTTTLQCGKSRLVSNILEKLFFKDYSSQGYFRPV